MDQLQNSILFAHIILPLPLRNQFLYRIPNTLKENISVGKRVIVQFGARKFYSGIVYKINTSQPEGFEVKDIISVLDEIPVVNEYQIKFWEWISSYYLCTLGEVMKAAIPAGLKLESETRVTINPDYETDKILTSSEEFIMRILAERVTLSVNEISKKYKKSDLLKVIKLLVESGAIILEESINRMPSFKTQTYTELMPEYNNEGVLRSLFDKLAKAPKQLQLLMRYVQLSGLFQSRLSLVTRKDLISDLPGGGEALRVMVKKGIFRTFEKKKEEDTFQSDRDNNIKLLSDFQIQALSNILEAFRSKKVVLLHGYTASGKTELYINLIDAEIKSGKQVLYLLPEIALTMQIIVRLKNAFGKKAGIYHSKFSDKERVEVWNKMMNPDYEERYQLILGVRSSIFLPFSNLGLVIVDEEHENSYKQFDPAPRYNARDAALMLARMHGAKTLLGTATPSVESYYNTQNGKYGLVEMFQRYSMVDLPDIFIANIEEARKRKQMKSVFHPMLLEAMSETLVNGKQVILFHNRRGFSTFMQCSVCNTISKCKNCDVSLTYHKNNNLLVCHYCGYSTSKINICQACGTPSMKMHGFGTEKIEDELSILFPGKRVARMDLDSARSRKTFENIISDLENNELDILVGTQMVTKGLDFDNVNLVGIIDADQLLNYPDFRAYERSFQLMSQVSGRAGRKDKRGKVIIQTTDVSNYIIRDVINNDFLHMYHSQLSEREKFGYPPFIKLVKLTVKQKNQSLVDAASDLLAEILKKHFGNRVIGPEYPIINRISNWFQKNIFIKIEASLSLSRVKELIIMNINELNEHSEFRSIIVQPDVDPM